MGDDLLQAADLLKQAVTRDPLFFQAYCQLAFTEINIYSLLEHTPEHLARPKQLCKQRLASVQTPVKPISRAPAIFIGVTSIMTALYASWKLPAKACPARIGYSR